MKSFSGKTSLCAKCKGRLWCGKNECPILIKFYSQTKTRPLINSTYINGSSPPSVFVGRYGYPKVFVGPMIPPQHGDTRMLDTPELWSGLSIQDIVDFRFKLVRGKYLTHIKNFDGRIIERTREIALADNSPDAEANFKKKPVGRIALHSEIQPFGPSAPLIKLDVGSYKFNRSIEKAFYDVDLKARNAVVNLYENGVLVSKIQKAFSVGAFGIDKNRKFVPTRWSITAVDSIISKDLIENTKTYPIINEFRVYEHKKLDNRWIVLLIPREWCYEIIEAWYPRTLWNPDSNYTSIFSDCEFHDGRKGYPGIGGCYFAARLAVNELLNKERRQAGAIVLREAHPGYIMPVGVWNVRQAVRETVGKEPRKFPTLEKSFDHISKKLDIPIKDWIKYSNVLRDTIQQKRIVDFIRVREWK